LLRQLERWELVLAGQRDVISLLRHSDDALRYDYLTGVLAANGSILMMLGRWDEALDVVGEIAEELRRQGVSGLEYGLSGALEVLVADGAGVPQGDWHGYERMAQDDAVVLLNQAAAAYRQRSHSDAHEHEHGLAVTLKLLAEALWTLSRPQESLAANAEAIEVRRHWHAANPPHARISSRSR